MALEWPSVLHQKPRRRSCSSTSTHLQFARRLTTTILVRRCQVLPKQSVVQVATTVEVEEGRKSGSLREVALGLGVADALEGGVEAGDVGLVVLGVVELHDLAGNVRLERAVVVCAGTPSQCMLLGFGSKVWAAVSRSHM